MKGLYRTMKAYSVFLLAGWIGGVATCAAAGEVEGVVRNLYLNGSAIQVEWGAADVKAGDEVKLTIAASVPLGPAVDGLRVQPPAHSIRTVAGSKEAPHQIFVLFAEKQANVDLRLTDPTAGTKLSYRVETEPAAVPPVTRISSVLAIENGTPTPWTNVKVIRDKGNVRDRIGEITAKPSERVSLTLNPEIRNTAPGKMFQHWVAETDFTAQGPLEIAKSSFQMPFEKGWPTAFAEPAPIDFVYNTQLIDTIPLSGAKPEEQLAAFQALIKKPLKALPTAPAQVSVVHRRLVKSFAAIKPPASTGNPLWEISSTSAYVYDPAPVVLFRTAAAAAPLSEDGLTEIPNQVQTDKVFLTVGFGQDNPESVGSAIDAVETLLKGEPPIRGDVDKEIREQLVLARERLKTLQPFLQETTNLRQTLLAIMFDAAQRNQDDRVRSGRALLLELELFVRDAIAEFNPLAGTERAFVAPTTTAIKDKIEALKKM